MFQKWHQNISGRAGRVSLIGAVSALAAMPAFAAEMVAISTEDVFLGEIPVVLSATRLEQPRSDAPASITIIDRETIEATGATEIPDLFRLVPGFQIGHDNNSLFSTDPVGVTYHGLSDSYARRIQVLIDGRSVYSPDFGGVRWSELPLEIDDIERIEIIRGPNGSAYGANSFLSVINIITRHPADVAGDYVKVVNGGNNLRKGLVRHAASTGKFDYRLSLAYRSDSGFDDQYDDHEYRFAAFRSEYRASNRDTYEFNFGLGAGPQQAGKPGSTDEQSPRIISQDSNYQQIRWKRRTDNNGEHQLQYYRNYHNYQDAFIATIGGFPNTPIDQGVTTERNNIEYQFTRKWNNTLRTVWGAEVRQDVSVANAGWFWGLGQVRNNITRSFINAEWHISPKLLSNIGVMAEYTDFTGAGISPSVAINYSLATGHTIRARVSRGLRTPSILESRGNAYANLGGMFPVLYYDADPDNRPEKITSYEIGYLFESRRRGLEADLRIFKDDITDLISYPAYTPAPPTARFMNGGYSTIFGAELEAKYRPSANTRIVAVYAWADQSGAYMTDYNAVGPVATFAPTTGVTPRQTYGVLGSYKPNRKTTLSLGVYHVDDMGWFSDLQTVPAYDKVDVRLARKFELGGTGAMFELVGQNLGNPYYTYNNTSYFERRWYIKLKLNIQ